MSTLNYPNLRKEELYLISRAEYEKRKLITSDFARKLFPQPKIAAAVLDSLSRKGRLIQLQRGKYFLVPIKAPNQQWTPNEYVVASLWMDEIPHYIGYFTMYHYWGYSDQIPQTVYILNTRRNAEARIGYTGYRAIKVDSSRIYGVQNLEIEGEIVRISDKERTLVDFIHRPIGSLETISMTLKKAIPSVDLDRLIGYIVKFPILSLRRRAGYLLDTLGFGGPSLNSLKKNLGHPSTYVVLDPKLKSRKGKIDKNWGIIVNR
jgi:predicted transcriptional regulator of viral defense system